MKKTLTEQSANAQAYIKKANCYKCSACNTTFLRLRKTPCPLCHSKDTTLIIKGDNDLHEADGDREEHRRNFVDKWLKGDE